MRRGINIYLAGPLFSVAEREFNKKLAESLEKNVGRCTVYLPQEYAASIIGQIGKQEFLDKVFNNCLESILTSDLVVAILDGADVDSGTCVEIGYAYANKKPIIGVRTDFRASEDKGVNLMVSKACSKLIRSPGSTITLEQILKAVTGAIDDFSRRSRKRVR